MKLMFPCTSHSAVLMSARRLIDYADLSRLGLKTSVFRPRMKGPCRQRSSIFVIFQGKIRVCLYGETTGIGIWNSPLVSFASDLKTNMHS